MPTTKLLLLLALVLLALFGVSSAQSSAQSCGTVYTLSNSDISGLLKTGIGLAALALTVSFDVVAIGYIIGKLLPATGVLSWINSEYWEIAKSAMLIASIYAIIVLAGSLAAPFVSSAAATSPLAALVNGAQSYLCTATLTVSNDLSYLSGISIGVGLWKHTSLGVYSAIPFPPFVSAFIFGFTFSPYQNQFLESSFITIVTYESLLNDIITVVALIVSVILIFQMDLLFAMVTIGLAVLIPIGLILRAFPFIRGVGGTLVALGIGIAVIYPATLAVFNAPVSSLIQNGLAWPTPAPPAYSSQPFWLSIYTGTVGSIVGGIIGSNAIYAPGYTAGMASFSSIYPGVNGIVNHSIYSIAQLLLFIVDLMVVYPLVDSLASLLGGTIRLQLGGKLKLA